MGSLFIALPIEASCPDQHANYTGFPANSTVVYNLSDLPEPAKSQARSALNDASGNNPLGVSFVENTQTTAVPNLVFTTGAALNENSQARPAITTVPNGTTYTNANGDVLLSQAVVTIDSQNQGGSWVDSNSSGYDTIFKKLATHEIGHLLGLADNTVGEGSCGGQSAGGSAMNAYCGAPNDSANNMATSLTTCDKDSIAQNPQGSHCDLQYCVQENMNCLGCDRFSCTCNQWDPGTPIIVDVNGDGYLLTSFEGGVPFDLFATGVRVQTAWTAANSDEALLARDLNQNGSIDDSTELFGNSTVLRNGKRAPHGWIALAEHDENRDGRITREDSIFAELLLWSDLDHDGMSSPLEVTPLGQTRVREIELRFNTLGRFDVFGNLFRYQSRVIWESGRSVPAYDVIFVGTRASNCQR